MKEARALLEKIARSPAEAILISGESGVGKDVAARLMHDLSARANARFAKLSCIDAQESALESALFGHDPAALHEESAKLGLLEEARGGTVFLDEISGLSLPLQAKLLRVLEEHAFQRVGGSDRIRTNVRLIASTHCNLRAEVAAGRFREDLYYRLAVLHVSLPPLCTREGDVEQLSKHFVRRFSTLYGKEVRGLSADALSILTRHGWPGNVRELKHVIERAILLTESETLRVADLSSLNERTYSDYCLTLPTQGLDLAQLERDLLKQALQRVQGNKTRAGALLGLTRDQVRHRAAKLDPEQGPSADRLR
jgi:DNA-binding NtrC family response regulator